MKLEELAQVMVGVLTKREYDENGENSYTLFSLKNHEENIEFERLKTAKNLSDKLAQNGDLLFRLVYPNKIICVDESLEGLLIPSQFCIIRPKNKKIDPVVLKWYLESKEVKDELSSKTTGSLIKSMKVSNLKTLDVPNISKETQKKMKQLITLCEKEKEISQKIIEEKEKLYNSYLESMLKRG